MSLITGRALHYVFKIGNRAKNSFFFRNILGMKVLRHEEFKEGCEAQCNGPYDNRWSKTMVGYGPESTHFVFELTYNYGVTRYEMGNDFAGVVLKSQESIERALANNYPMTDVDGKKLLLSPDGYKFYIIPEPQPTVEDPVVNVGLHVTNLVESKKYWHDILLMNIVSEDENSLLLNYSNMQAALNLKQISEPLDRAKAYGRIAFSVPKAQQPYINDVITQNNGKILTPLIELDTPGKETVRVIILADPDGHETCFVDDEGFTKLSAVEVDADKNLDKYIGKDPFQKELDAAEE
ncbi:glyoxalase domain-containing protein 4-like [Musca vetustissima]|uniref:glyoxalase domain-containing protein 4-like n=1 Tax=Musca vetustissima TaxID=27455 RepID=UPI002AB5F53B|nr:glyoxalase domain-containing protein 4-like [Musca vetustissima]